MTDEACRHAMLSIPHAEHMRHPRIHTRTPDVGVSCQNATDITYVPPVHWPASLASSMPRAMPRRRCSVARTGARQSNPASAVARVGKPQADRGVRPDAVSSVLAVGHSYWHPCPMASLLSGSQAGLGAVTYAPWTFYSSISQPLPFGCENRPTKCPSIP